ncbi:MAG TPA: alanine racemase [Acidimicrobiales bacterium]|nr:alanine racemase [Acidimicrobiales bacterium]
MADTGPAPGTGSDSAESPIVPGPAAGRALGSTGAVGSSRLAWAEVDLDAIATNCAVLAGLARPAALCAVVKANAYGHGAVPAARAALAGGATWLAVALVEEGIALREAGIEAPVLLLSEPLAEVMEAAAASRLTPTIYTAGGIKAARKATASVAGGGPFRVHVKVDTGMHRVGADPDSVIEVAAAVDAAAELHLEGLWTHLAVADDPDRDDFTAEQLRRFEQVRHRLAAAGIEPEILHAANSSALLAHPSAHNQMVRCGLTVYGYPPSAALADRVELRPAMSLKAGVSFVRRLSAGERVSYGLQYGLPVDSVIATVPLGYSDGVPRRFSAMGGQVLIGGRRLPIAGRVTMDQLLVDCGPGSEVAPGDEVVLLGRQGDEQIDATEWADRLGTVPYEILCGVSARVARHYVGTGAVADSASTGGKYDQIRAHPR